MADVLGRLHAAPAVSDLLAVAFLNADPQVRQAAGAALDRLHVAQRNSAAAARLEREARDFFEHGTPLGADPLERVTVLWHWDENQNRIVAQPVSPEIAQVTVAARLADDAYRLTAAEDST